MNIFIQIEVLFGIQVEELDCVCFFLLQVYMLLLVVYIFDDVYEWEIECIMCKVWLFLVRVDQLFNFGDYLSFDIFD